MTKRIKLIRVKTSLSIEELGIFFHKTKFSPGASYGFLDIEQSNSKLSATYVEKESTYQEFIDPLGEVYEQSFVTYNTFSFIIEPLTNNILLLSVINPPRTIKNFINMISSKLNYLVAFSSINISINELLDCISKNINISLVKIRKLKISGMKLNDDSTACIEITSNKNAFDDLADYTKNAHFSIEKIKGDMLMNERSVTFEITKTGLVSISDDECSIDFIFEAIQR